MAAGPSFCSVHIVFKQIILVLCFANIVFDHNAGQLFLWPLDHSCARSANLSLFTDSRQHPIDLDAIQKNLIAATPEDSFTRARAASMGIEYDDIARCFEYPVEYTSNQSTMVNMESLETCHFGLHFEKSDPNLSLVEHFNLACSRQWLKNLVPQMFALGLLIGCLVSYCLLRRKRRLRVVSKSSIVLLLVWLIVFLITNRLHDNHHKHQQQRFKPVDPTERDQDFAQLLLGIFLRSAVVSMIMCRVLATWKPFNHERRAGPNDPTISSGHEERFTYFKIFCCLVVLAKLLFMPIALRLMTDWSMLNRFLTYNMSLVVSLSLLIELAYSSDQLDQLRHFLRGQSLKQGGGKPSVPRRQPIELIDSSNQDENVDEIPNDQNLVGSHERARPSGSGRDHIDLGDVPNARSREAEAGRFCEFCSIKGQGMLARSMQSSARETEEEDLAESAPPGPSNETTLTSMAMLANDTYAPTTVSIGFSSLHGKAGEIDQDGGSYVYAGQPTGTKAKARGLRRSSGSRAIGRQARGLVTHDISLVELNLFRWPVISKLLVLTFCLAFNYFLLQTMPNHKLLHLEPIPAIAKRRIDMAKPTQEPASGRESVGHHGEVALIQLETLSGDNRTLVLDKNSTIAYLPLNYDKRPNDSIEFDADSARLPSEHVDNSSSLKPSQIVGGILGSGIVRVKAKSDEKLPPAVVAGASSLAKPKTAAPSTSSAPSRATKSRTRRSKMPKAAKRGKRDDGVGAHEVNAASEQHQAAGGARDNIQGVPSGHQPGEQAASYRLIFDYKKLDYASQTLETLRESDNPFEIMWTMQMLNGWPIEMAAILLHSSSLTNTQWDNFKLHRLFLPIKHGTMVLVLEWLLVALVRSRNHLIELDWLLATILTLARLITTLLFYGHLHMLFRLAHRLQSSELLKLYHLLPVVLVAFSLALTAPIFERTDLIIIPISILLSNLLANLLALRIETRFKSSLCPMMFEGHDDER